jgi:ABC-2 type transport system permease protein
MSDVGLALAQTRYSTKGFVRNPQALIFTVIMPVFLLVIFNAIFHGHTTFLHIRVGFASYYTASLIAYQMMLAGCSSLLIAVVTDREAGELKRFRGTPMPRWIYLTAEILRTLGVVTVTVAVLIAVGTIFYHVRFTSDTLIGVVVYVVLGTCCMCAIGLALTRVASTTDSASVIGPFTTLVLAFISGVFIPTAVMPKWLVDVEAVEGGE